MVIELKKIRNYLVLFSCLLVFLHFLGLLLVDKSWHYVRLMDLGHEANIPTWFMSLLWILCALLSFVSSGMSAPGKERSLFILLAFIFLVLSCDETAQLHEMVGKLLDKYLIDVRISTEWVVFLGPFILVGLFFVVKKTLNVLKSYKTARNYIVGGLSVFVFAVVIMEFLSSFMTGMASFIEITIEESSEMAGALLIITGLLEYIRSKGLRNLSIEIS